MKLCLLVFSFILFVFCELCVVCGGLNVDVFSCARIRDFLPKPKLADFSKKSDGSSFVLFMYSLFRQ